MMVGDIPADVCLGARFHSLPDQGGPGTSAHRDTAYWDIQGTGTTGYGQSETGFDIVDEFPASHRSWKIAYRTQSDSISFLVQDLNILKVQASCHGAAHSRQNLVRSGMCSIDRYPSRHRLDDGEPGRVVRRDPLYAAEYQGMMCHNKVRSAGNRLIDQFWSTIEAYQHAVDLLFRGSYTKPLLSHPSWMDKGAKSSITEVMSLTVIATS